MCGTAALCIISQEITISNVSVCTPGTHRAGSASLVSSAQRLEVHVIAPSKHSTLKAVNQALPASCRHTGVTSSVPSGVTCTNGQTFMRTSGPDCLQVAGGFVVQRFVIVLAKFGRFVIFSYLFTPLGAVLARDIIVVVTTSLRCR